MALVKIFSGSEIMALAAETKLKEAGIPLLMKNNITGGTVAGFGTAGLAVEIFVDEEHAEEARQIVQIV